MGIEKGPIIFYPNQLQKRLQARMAKIIEGNLTAFTKEYKDVVWIG
jgi:hypothetical protein